MNDITKGLVSDYKRDKANNKLETTEYGIVVPTAKIAIGGIFGNSLNGGEWEYSRNTVVFEGLDAILGLVFDPGGTTSYTGFYLGLILTGTPADGNTLLSKGFTESTDYTGTDWKTWDQQGVSSQSITNAGSGSPAQFTMGGSDTPITGAFLANASVATKGGTTGYLIAASLFASSRIVGASDVLDVDYTVSMADV